MGLDRLPPRSAQQCLPRGYAVQKRVHIIGRKNSGKTTLITELVQFFTRRGYRIGTIKHTHHQHELDTPGKDSHRHRIAGAAVVGIMARNMNAVFWPAGNLQEKEARYRQMEPMFGSCDLVLVEGDVQTAAPKLEVWRSATGTVPLAAEDPGVLALITDDVAPCSVRCIARRDLEAVARFVAELCAVPWR